MSSLLIALLAGLLSALGFAPLGWWSVAVACFAGLILLVGQAGTYRRAVLTGYLFGFGQFVVGLNWIAGAFRYQEAMPVWLGWVAVVALSLYLAIYPALAAGLAWGLRRHRLAFPLGFAAAWIATEWLRATLFTGFAWNPLGVVLVDTPVRGLSRLVGTYGLSGIAVLLAAALADARRLLAFPAAAVAALTGGWLTLASDPGRTQALVRIVQPNIGQQDKHDESFDEENFTKLAGLSGRPGPRPRLLLWPEAAVPWYLEHERGARERIGALLGPNDRLLLGGDALVVTPGKGVTGARASFFAIDAEGTLHGRYDKAHLVPYGEYLPMRPILSALGLARLVPGDLDFMPGPGPRSLDVAGFGRIGGQLCYEITFSGEVVDSARRPAAIFNPSNDAWFGSWGPPQHLAQARLRATEEGLPILRSTPTGISAVIDSRGALLVALPLGKAGFIQTELPRAAAPTPFARGGNTLALLFAALLALAAVALAARRR